MMTRETELELLILESIAGLVQSQENYGIQTSTFRGWLDDLNKYYEEYFRLTNERSRYD